MICPYQKNWMSKVLTPSTERTQTKMNEYLYEMEMSTMDTVSDEEIMIMNTFRKVRLNRKKRQQKENYLNGEYKC